MTRNWGAGVVYAPGTVVNALTDLRKHRKKLFSFLSSTLQPRRLSPSEQSRGSSIDYGSQSRRECARIFCPNSLPAEGKHMKRRYLTTLLLVVFASLTLRTAARAGDEPDDFQIVEATIAQLQAQYREGNLSPEDVVEMYLTRIARFDEAAGQPLHGGIGPQPLNSFMHVNNDFDGAGRLQDGENGSDDNREGGRRDKKIPRTTQQPVPDAGNVEAEGIAAEHERPSIRRSTRIPQLSTPRYRRSFS